MIKEFFFTGKTIDEAWETACKELGYDADDKCYQIVEMAKKGFLGIGSTPAKIKVEVEVPDQVKPAKKPEVKREERKPQPKKETPKPEKKEEKKEQEPAPVKIDPMGDKKMALAVDYVKSVLNAMEIVAEVTAENRGDGAVITLTGEDLGVIIGRRGETLDALQYLASLVANKGDDNYFRISIDSGDYRAKREDTLKELARRMANSAIKKGRNVTLEPMNPYERRIIHATVAEIQGVGSKSVGEEPNRRVVITVKGGRSDNRGRGGRRNDNRGRGRRNDRPSQTVASAPNPNAVSVRDEEEKPLYSKIEL